MDFDIIMYIILGALAVAGGIVLIMAKHPIRGALGLLLTMLSLAGMYAILSAHAIAVFQLIIYAGAIMVLLLFVIMLLNLRRDEFGPERRKLQKFFGILFAVILFIEIGALVKLSLTGLPSASKGLDPAFGGAHAVGKLLFTDYLFPFEVTSVLLLVAIVGAIVMAKRKL